MREFWQALLAEAREDWYPNLIWFFAFLTIFGYLGYHVLVVVSGHALKPAGGIVVAGFFFFFFIVAIILRTLATSKPL